MRILKYRKTNRARAVNRKRHEDNRARQRMPVTKGDTVMVVRGDDKGKSGQVIKVFPKKGRVTVKGVNIVKRHRKARTADEKSGIIEMEAPIHVSNVMHVDPKNGTPTRIRHRIDEDGTKERISVASGEAIPRAAR
jgi:large subunit ribosomal protein L24